MHFSPQEWLQIRAALTLWLEVTTKSRVHPIEHPAVQRLYTNTPHPPLSSEDVLELIERPFYKVPPPGTTASRAAAKLGVPSARLARWLKRHCEPIDTVGPFFLWSWRDVTDGAKELRKKTKAFKERYGRWHASVR